MATTVAVLTSWKSRPLDTQVCIEKEGRVERKGGKERGREGEREGEKEIFKKLRVAFLKF